MNSTPFSLHAPANALNLALRSGDSAELEDGVWTRYGEDGEPLEQVSAKDKVELAQGDNAFSVEGRFTDGSPFRVETTVFALGETMDAFVRDLSPKMRATMSRETVMPFVYAPSKGFAGKLELPVRPDEEATLDIDILGPVDKPSFSWKSGWFGRTTVELEGRECPGMDSCCGRASRQTHTGIFRCDASGVLVRRSRRCIRSH